MIEEFFYFTFIRGFAEGDPVLAFMNILFLLMAIAVIGGLSGLTHYLIDISGPTRKTKGIIVRKYHRPGSPWILSIFSKEPRWWITVSVSGGHGTLSVNRAFYDQIAIGDTVKVDVTTGKLSKRTLVVYVYQQ